MSISQHLLPNGIDTLFSPGRAGPPQISKSLPSQLTLVMILGGESPRAHQNQACIPTR